ncbi:polysaccharide pyruvyl transferase CsaB [Fervidibacillus halotolerans]|uniref:Polysaccharide pyruvyl transferase CsaB n=1 Tax=Fervidibacillus halotolerans TaxID=2980027 RepID=A0A9E8RYE0_9BACI|nr:polysaccharide pyruvyl transferase CsaB [Fervidibacillus halotolerans]WAA12138.1 polysaccharide pyruvyl transferase CsaB [Fervidibacillus halotolerans]
MHFVISGYYGFNNVGDEAILFSIISTLRKRDPHIELTVLSNDPEATKKAYNVNAVNRWKLKEIRRAIRQSDGLISGGGSLLQDKTGFRSIPYYTGIMRIAMFYKKPVYIYAQGIGPISRKFNKWLVRTTLQRTTKITVRDEPSHQLLKDLGVNRDITVVPDPVLGLDAEDFTCSWLENNPISTPFVTVAIRDWPSKFDFKREIAACLDRLVKRGYSIVFVPMHQNVDESASRDVAQFMEEKSTIAPGNLTIEEKIALIGASDLLIGARLHSLIFAAITYTPFLALSYDPKIDAFASSAEQPVIGHVEQGDWNRDSLLKASIHALTNKAFIEDQLKNKVKKWRGLSLTTW